MSRKPKIMRTPEKVSIMQDKDQTSRKNTLEKAANVDERKLYITGSVALREITEEICYDYNNKHQTYPTRNVLSKGDAGQLKSFKWTDREALELEFYKVWLGRSQ